MEGKNVQPETIVSRGSSIVYSFADMDTYNKATSLEGLGITSLSYDPSDNGSLRFVVMVPKNHMKKFEDVMEFNGDMEEVMDGLKVDKKLLEGDYLAT